MAEVSLLSLSPLAESGYDLEDLQNRCAAHEKSHQVDAIAWEEATAALQVGVVIIWLNIYLTSSQRRISALEEELGESRSKADSLESQLIQAHTAPSSIRC